MFGEDNRVTKKSVSNFLRSQSTIWAVQARNTVPSERDTIEVTYNDIFDIDITPDVKLAEELEAWNVVTVERNVDRFNGMLDEDGGEALQRFLYDSAHGNVDVRSVYDRIRERETTRQFWQEIQNASPSDFTDDPPS